MRLELPPASSIRSSGTRGKARKRRSFLLPSALFVLALLAIGAKLIVDAFSLPRLEGLEPGIGEPGGEVLLLGRNFGASRGDSRVDVDGMVPTASSYLEWSDERIRLRLPASFDSGLLRVVTRMGSSGPRLFMNRARLPIVSASERVGVSGPVLLSIEPEEGAIGSLIALRGLGFGAGRGNSKVFFAWTAEVEGGMPPGDRSLPAFVSSSEADAGYELWSDKELRLRVPDGAVSGSVYVATGERRSNAIFFRVSSPIGSKRYSSRTSYSISQSISIKKVKTSGSSELYLWMPLPLESASQRILSTFGLEPEPIMPEYHGTALFRFADLATGRDAFVHASFLVQVFATEASIDPYRAPERPQNPPSLIAAYTAADALVPASAPAIQELARRILGGEKGSWRAARLVWDWLGKNLSWTDRHEHERVLDALKDKTADSYSYAIIAAALLRAAGLPTLPLAGYLVDAGRKAVRHYWVELYLYGLGWIPLDPVLGAGASPGGIRAPWEDRGRYFGGLDARHIAFSKGLSVLAPLTPAGKRVSKERRWSFQSFYEEAAGALDAYSSYWGDIEVTGMY